MNLFTAFITGLLSLIMVLISTIHPTQVPNQPKTTQPTLTKPASSDTSLNWAGYRATNGMFTGVSGTWTVPKINSTNTQGADATWVGIGGVTTDDLIQAGTMATVNHFGQVSYSAFYEGLPDFSQPFTISVHQGDVMTVSLHNTENDSWNIAIKNNTTGESNSVTFPYSSSFSSAEWIEEAPTGLRQMLPLDDFGTVSITKATATKNGQSLTLAQVAATPIAMSRADDITLAQASVLNTDGTSFTVSRTNQPLAEQSTYRTPGAIPIFGRKHIFRFSY